MRPWHRRGFLIAAGATCTAAGAMAWPARAAALPSAAMIVADTRFAASRAFAKEAAKSGGRVVWIAGDITDLWYDELDLLWRRERVSLTGLTTYAPFFYLERLGMDRGMRMTLREEHSQAGQRLVRWAIAPLARHGRGRA